MLKLLVIYLVISALSGCASTSGFGGGHGLDNLVTCAIARDKAFVTSMWWVVGIASEIRAADTEILCGEKR